MLLSAQTVSRWHPSVVAVVVVLAFALSAVGCSSSSSASDADAGEVARAFLAASEERSFHGRKGFIADGWSENSPYVAAWHEPDDLVVWVAGLSITKDQTIAAAEASIELTPEQWQETTRFSPECGC